MESSEGSAFDEQALGRTCLFASREPNIIYHDHRAASASESARRINYVFVYIAFRCLALLLGTQGITNVVI